MRIPRPRKSGQIGGLGGHGRNMHNAQKRDQAPYGNRGSGKVLLTLILVVATVVVVGAFCF